MLARPRAPGAAARAVAELLDRPARGALGPDLAEARRAAAARVLDRGRARPVLHHRRPGGPARDHARPPRRPAAAPPRDPRQPGRAAGAAAAAHRRAQGRGGRPGRLREWAAARRARRRRPRRARAGAARGRVRRALRAPRPRSCARRQPRRRRPGARARPPARRDRADVRAAIAERFREVLVDELEDAGVAHRRAARALVAAARQRARRLRSRPGGARLPRRGRGGAPASARVPGAERVELGRPPLARPLGVAARGRRRSPGSYAATRAPCRPEPAGRADGRRSGSGAARTSARRRRRSPARSSTCSPPARCRPSASA